MVNVLPELVNILVELGSFQRVSGKCLPEMVTIMLMNVIWGMSIEYQARTGENMAKTGERRAKKW